MPRGRQGDKANATQNTYDGKGGVPIGNAFNKLLYAFKFAEPNIFLSSRVNSESKILYDREPRDRVKKVAPWLTVDGDSYPAVVNGRVVWIVDGYTTSNSYPYSEHRSLREATADTLTDGNSQAALPTDQVNYMRNSVKAVVDAYDGTVKLYQWDTKDPVLKTWMKVFPDVVEPKSEISNGLLEHLRYPVDLFKVQRDVLQRYHVTDAQTFYDDGERWKVPEDPTAPTGSNALQPPYYLSTARPGEDDPEVLGDQRLPAQQPAEPRGVRVGQLRGDRHRQLRQDADPAAAERDPDLRSEPDRQRLPDRQGRLAGPAAVPAVQDARRSSTATC